MASLVTRLGSNYNGTLLASDLLSVEPFPVTLSKCHFIVVVVCSSWRVCVVCWSVQTQYTLARAQQSFKSLVHIHEKGGNISLCLSVCLSVWCVCLSVCLIHKLLECVMETHVHDKMIFCCLYIMMYVSVGNCTVQKSFNAF